MFIKDIRFMIIIEVFLVALLLQGFVEYGNLYPLWISSLCLFGYATVTNTTFKVVKRDENNFFHKALLETFALGALTISLKILGPTGFSVVLLTSLLFFMAWKSFSWSFLNISLIITSFLLYIPCSSDGLSFQENFQFLRGIILNFMGACVLLQTNYNTSFKQGGCVVSGVTLLGGMGFAHSYLVSASDKQLSLFSLILVFLGSVVALMHKFTTRFTPTMHLCFMYLSLFLFFEGIICHEHIVYQNYGMFLVIPSSIFMYVICRRELSLIQNTKSLLDEYGFNGKLFIELRKDKRKQKFFLFFLLTVLVMFLELAYGASVNSLGLISDAFHMMIDSMSIAVGFLAAYASSWSPNPKTHSFGYSRYEVLGGFINGILLLLISTHVIIESIQRFIDPPEINASHMFSVSIIGLLVNIIGVIFFHDFHAHSHSHNSDSCCSKQVDCNMRGVFLHILADLLGSVSVIISSIFVHLFNIWIADPICSIFSAIFIFISAIPLLIDTGKILLMSGPDSNQNFCEVLRERIYATSLLSEVSLPKLWVHSTAPHGLLVCLVDVKLKNTENYFSVKHSLLHLIEETVSENFEMNKANIILHLE